MKLTVVIHTEDKDKLSKLFELIEKNPNKKYFSLYLHAKGYVPWEDDKLKNVIVSFKSYNAFPTIKSKIESVVEIVSIVKDEKILIFDEDCDSFNLNEWDDKRFNFLLSSKEDIIKLNLDTKYQTLKWFIVDLISQKNKTKVGIIDDSEDSIRYFKKIESPIFYNKIIYVDGGMGDHIMALPLLEKIQNDIHICCKYPFVFEHLNSKGIIHWDDDLFGGYKRFVYEHGSLNNSKTIIDAFFEMYGYERNENDLLVYNGIREKNQINTNGKPIALICSSAAKIQNLDSNKDWRDIRWLKLVHELQKQNYYVVQVGTIKDNQIPTVDLKYLDKLLPELASLIDDSSLWISVDTFFHHFASSIKPNVGICLTPFYNDHAKHKGVTYIEKDCGKDFSDRKWWTDLQQPERKECMDLIQLEDVLPYIKLV
jgi:ADP-heptose:LPS heptosyltransferase